MPARKSVRKRRSLRNPPSKRPSLAEQWDEYDAAVLARYYQFRNELAWAEEGAEWARRDVARGLIPSGLESRSFNPESDAADRWSDAATEVEARDGIGWLGAQIGYVNELERLTGRTFRRFNTVNADERIENWSAPMAQIQKMFKKPRGTRPY